MGAHSLLVSPAVTTGHGGITTYARGVAEVLGRQGAVAIVAPPSNSPRGAVMVLVSSWLAVIRHRPRLVHALTWRVAAGVAILPKPLRPRLVVHCLGAELLRVGPVTRWIRDLVFRRADALVAISRYTASVVRDVSGRDPAVVHPVHEARAHDADRPRRSEGTLRVLSVARFQPRKGHRELVDVIEALRSEGKDIRLTIAGGDGPSRAELVQAAGEAGRRSWLSVETAPDDDRLRELYLASDLFALLTMNDKDEFEGFGIVFLEAASAGLPSVATDSGGVADAVGKGGVVVTDAGAAQVVIGSLYDDRATLAQLAERAVEHAQAFTVEKIRLGFERSNLL